MARYVLEESEPKRRQQRIKQEKKEKFVIFTRKWLKLYLFITILFVVAVIFFDIIPSEYVIVGIIAVSVVTILISLPLAIRQFNNNRRLISLLLSFILCVGYIYVGVQIVNTIGFLERISNLGGEYAEFYVVSANTYEFEVIDDIYEMEVMVHDVQDEATLNAKSTIKNEYVVTFEYIDTVSKIAELLMESTDTYGTQQESDYGKIALISDSNYKLISEEYPLLSEKVKILETIEIEIEMEDITKNVDVVEDPFNILISGMDTTGSIDYLSRSDVNMLLTVNPVSKKILITSIPRDYYIDLVGVTEDGLSHPDKLTHVGNYGINSTVRTIESFLGVDINYYVKVNFSTMIELIDAIGGLEVYSGYTFEGVGLNADVYTYYEGMNQLDGDQVLAFSRARKPFESGDIQRNNNQQHVLTALIDKATKSTTILTNYSSILAAVDEYVETNFSQEEITELIKMQLDEMTGWEIETSSIIGTPDVGFCYTLNDYASIIIGSTEEEVEVVNKIKEVSATDE